MVERSWKAGSSLPELLGSLPCPLSHLFSLWLSEGGRGCLCLLFCVCTGPSLGHSAGICSNLKGQLLAPRLLFPHLNPTCSASPPAPASPRGTPGLTHTQRDSCSPGGVTVTVTVTGPFWGQQELEKELQEWVGLYFTHGKSPTLRFCSTQSNNLGNHH